MLKRVLVAAFQQLNEKQISAIKGRHGDDVIIEQITPELDLNFIQIFDRFFSGQYTDLIIVNVSTPMLRMFGFSSPYGETSIEEPDPREAEYFEDNHGYRIEQLYDLRKNKTQAAC